MYKKLILKKVKAKLKKAKPNPETLERSGGELLESIEDGIDNKVGLAKKELEKMSKGKDYSEKILESFFESCSLLAKEAREFGFKW
ncbi:hypothetical protein N9948_01490 [bacterium]|nr:hypothetical protein [bacterium]